MNNKTAKKGKNAGNEKLKTSIGGQALLEGIMMRGPKKTAIAVRGTDGEITVEIEPTSAGPSGVAKIPVVRGVVNFVFSMICGYKALMRSAQLCGLDEMIDDEAKQDAEKEKPNCEEKVDGNDVDKAVEKVADNDAEKTAEKDTKNAEDVENKLEDSGEMTADVPPVYAEKCADDIKDDIKSDKKDKKKEEKSEGFLDGKVMTAIMIVSVVLGVFLAMFLFKFIPETIYELLTKAFPGMTGEGYGYNLLRAAVTGVMKIVILVAYMALVSLMKDIRRTFMYHGAEHKSIFCYEKGLELTVENVRRQRRFHPRCGTSFLVLMVLVSIVVSMFIPAQLVANKFLNIIARTGIGVLLLPIIMGIGYELIKFAGRHDNIVTRVISAPGVWLQHITTREPDDDMIECAIAALKEVIPNDGSDKW